MKKLLLPIILLLFIMQACNEKQAAEKKLPRIAIAGIGIESSTFSPAQTHEEAFHARIGDSIFGRYPFLPKVPIFENEPIGYQPY